MPQSKERRHNRPGVEAGPVPGEPAQVMPELACGCTLDRRARSIDCLSAARGCPISTVMRWALTDSNRRPLPCKGSALAN